MARSYKRVRVKKNHVYSVTDLMAKFEVSKNTVSNWVQGGLRPSEKKKPYLFQGAEIQRFHKDRRERSRINLRPGEFKCIGCKLAVFPEIDTISDWISSRGKHMFQAVCPDCGAMLMKVSSKADRAAIEDCRNPNTSRDCLHEGMDEDLGGIGTRVGKLADNFCCANDRLLYFWLNYAGRYDDKTIDQHLAAIRYCEKLVKGKAFDQLSVSDISSVREDLKRRAQATEDDHLSASSIKHIVSHLRAFTTWLAKQDGYRKLPSDLAEYLNLPKAILSAGLSKIVKEYPTILEAEDMLMAMPAFTIVQQRSRAIFALAFLGALRADTLISLQMKHFDVLNRRILQDASTVRAKNGKSLIVAWFPLPKVFAEEVINWVKTLKSLGFVDCAPLFPRETDLEKAKLVGMEKVEIVLPMKTKQAVTKAFAIASQYGVTNYTPHSAKHTIAHERDTRSLTHLQRKAWSENMGHETEQITDSHYGKLTDEMRLSAFDSIGEEKLVDLVDLSDQQKIAIVDAVINQRR